MALDPNPLNSGELVATTAFGDLRLEFQGIAPGIRAVPQVKANIAELLSRPGVSLASLRPGPEELSTATATSRAPSWSASRSVRSLSSRSCSPGMPCSADAAAPALVVAGLVGWFASTAITGLTLFTTYQPDRQETFTSTGVLGTLQRNQGILSDVESRATQVAPYLRNLIALSTALQQKYQAAPLESDTSLRVLLVSDIHAGNQYDLMRTIIEEEGSTSSSTPATWSTSARSRRPRRPACSPASGRSACPTSSCGGTTTRTARPTPRCSTAWPPFPT